MATPALVGAPTANAAPACGEAPQVVGREMIGTPCADTIRLPRAVTTAHGEGGDDVIFGQRGNDRLLGGEGHDRLYGGIGDDQLRGGPGDDLLSGGFGADSLDGEAGDDLARGDATIDFLGDSGGGLDTISFATGVTPGFPNDGPFFEAAGFPARAEGQGLFIELGGSFANNGAAPSGGGVDGPLPPATDFTAFEIVIGTPFPDYLVGSDGDEVFYGGGGADLIDGGGGADLGIGGADGDDCVDVESHDCESSDGAIDLRDPGAIAVGAVAVGGRTAAYLTGSDGPDQVVASYAGGQLTFARAAGSLGGFAAPAPPCAAQPDGTVACPAADLDALLLAGGDGADALSAPGLPPTASLVLLGNGADDILTGGPTEDALVDGVGDDASLAGAGDDALPNNAGADRLDAGPGEDLFVSNAVCDGDVLDGGPDRDNANWANFGAGVAIDMAARTAGLIGAGGGPSCPGPLTELRGVEDIEGTNLGDNLVGDAGPNQILGRAGADNYLAGAGDDHLLANSGDADATIDCGPGFDTALVDRPAFGDPAPVGCESVEARDPNSFRPPDTPPGPAPPDAVGPPPPPPPPPAVDRDPPATAIAHAPRARLRARRGRRTVAFRFRADEPAVFRCRIDRRPYRACRSPRRYRLGPGRHAFRVFAVDVAGNRDRTPATRRIHILRR